MADDAQQRADRAERAVEVLDKAALKTSVLSDTCRLCGALVREGVFHYEHDTGCAITHPDVVAVRARMKP